MATHSSVLAWRIPGTREPGGLLSMGSHRVGHDWSDLAAAAVAAALTSPVRLGTMSVYFTSPSLASEPVPDYTAGRVYICEWINCL